MGLGPLCLQGPQIRECNFFKQSEDSLANTSSEKIIFSVLRNKTVYKVRVQFVTQKPDLLLVNKIKYNFNIL